LIGQRSILNPVALLLVFVTAAVATISPARAQSQQSGMTMSAEAAFEGHFKYGEWLPVWVQVENNGADLDAELRVRIATTAPEEVSCNLEQRGTTQRAGYSEVLFASGTEPLPEHHVVRFELWKLPEPWTSYGKWIAVLLLIALIVCGSIPSRRRRSTAEKQISEDQIQDCSPSSRVETPRSGKPAARRRWRRPSPPW